MSAYHSWHGGRCILICLLPSSQFLIYILNKRLPLVELRRAQYKRALLPDLRQNKQREFRLIFLVDLKIEERKK